MIELGILGVDVVIDLLVNMLGDVVFIVCVVVCEVFEVFGWIFVGLCLEDDVGGFLWWMSRDELIGLCNMSFDID